MSDTPSDANLIPAPEPNHHGDLPAWLPGRRAQKYWTSLPADTQAGRVTLLRALGKADESGQSALGQVLHVVHVLIHEVELVNDTTGEVQTLPRTVLVGPDGRTWAYVSLGITRWIGWLQQFCGPPPWTPALAIVVKQVQTRKGFRTYEIGLADTAPATEEPPKKGGHRGK